MAFDAVTVGSALVDHVYSLSNLPEPDGGAFVRDESRSAGGVAANVATALTRLGRETGVVARVGDDEDGSFVETDLENRGIDATRVRRGDEDSSHCLILRDPDGERMIIAGGDSVPALRLTAADIEYLRGARVVFTTAYAPDEAVSRLVAARRNDALPPLAFDLAGPLSELDGRGTTRETLDEALSVFDLLVTSEVPVRSYLGVGPHEAVEEFRARGVERGAVTRGRDGALLFDDSGVTEIPAFDVPVADTTGAGDAHTAGLIHRWLLGERSAEEAGEFAAAVAALNCGAEGARGGFPTEREVATFR
ncbi:carbohydrate kinase [Haladaptatus sp. W1]|uniref:carbohydrate kinase family protein n=1 Tax=Haladaptatus sp. W1 TaxID=1897478 RepID=UPI000849A40A|nr:carbohydrate kinase family protein [Haladaptatus sp. W1]ODR83123.1 carbohydrate kinase [Haladaptatus sp. W1]